MCEHVHQMDQIQGCDTDIIDYNIGICKLSFIKEDPPFIQEEGVRGAYIN